MRDRLAAFAAELGVPHDDFSALMTAVGEALANAVEHAGSDEPIEVECRAAGDRIVVTVRDTGVGFLAEELTEGALDLPCAEAERGRGIVIMSRCSDIFTIESRPGRGTSVTVGRLLRSGLLSGRTRHEPGPRAALA